MPPWCLPRPRGPMSEAEREARAMADTERYCVGYERTFHGEWETGADRAVAGPPVLFRIGANSRGAGCYAQLNMRTPPGVAPYELPRFRARAKGGGTAWTASLPRNRSGVRHEEREPWSAARAGTWFETASCSPDRRPWANRRPRTSRSATAALVREVARSHLGSSVPGDHSWQILPGRAGPRTGTDIDASHGSRTSHRPVPRRDARLSLAQPTRRTAHGIRRRHPRLRNDYRGRVFRFRRRR